VVGRHGSHRVAASFPPLSLFLFWGGGGARVRRTLTKSNLSAWEKSGLSSPCSSTAALSAQTFDSRPLDCFFRSFNTVLGLATTVGRSACWVCSENQKHTLNGVSALSAQPPSKILYDKRDDRSNCPKASITAKGRQMNLIWDA
jgi:hypothetical protein